MGFSVSGSAAIIFVSMFIAFGAWYTASANTFEQVTEAETANTDAALGERNTRMAITSATYTGGTLTVTANNTGAKQLSLSDTDLLVDGQIVTNWQGDNATIEGYGDTDLWMAGEELTISLSRSTQPTRVKLVTETGVADIAEVTT
jgi:flagellar protein FlaF